ncbi:unnamed protein product [Bursaphelenchus xylophilus]|uniref:L-Fucosyltransferase n=1 Tax=Bursaphelenchus xylophilus TaxID=6326 RepID=A0A1I7S1Y0_BURXY|nr:unnamed protein product [Bursaphelenchus xylophilus]CAG9090089.1 unnamed protein product [Bursaphelenchus xylophilus]
MKPPILRRSLFKLIVVVLVCLILRTLVYLIFNKNSQHEAKIDVEDDKSRLIQLKQVRILPIGGSNVIFDQPWDLPSEKSYNTVEEAVKSTANRRYIVSSMSYSHGLGNLMFEYAALYYYARKYKAFLVFPDDCLLRRAFEKLEKVIYVNSTSLYEYVESNEDRRIQEKACCVYLPDLEMFKSSDIEIVDGYFQAFRYFWPELDSEVRKSFQFLEGVKKRALDYIRPYQDRIRIGVHVRHGVDITWHSRNLHHGHVSAPAEYYGRAMRRVSNGEQVVFVVVSDNISWAKRNLVGDNIVFVDSTEREVDLAILSYCNHTIMSTGTFSWWAGYLANGTTVRFKDWPRNGSDLDHMVDKKNYFLPHWIEL